MNERIRELQSKSYLMCKQIVDDDGHVVVTPDQWFDKFAELLVRECAELVGGYTKENEFGSASDVKEAYEEITKHFGVE